MTFAKKMLRAAIPSQELPKWFEATASSSDGKTTLALHVVVDGQAQTFERVLEKEDASVMDVLSMWPGVVEKVPSLAKGTLSFLPIPRNCTIKGAPAPVTESTELTPSKEIARLTLSATVAGNKLEHHWDSSLDRLYMADLVEMFDWLKAIQKTKDGKEDAGG